MPSPARMSLLLSPRWRRFVDTRVASGRYDTKDEVIREGLRLLEDRERSRSSAIDELRREIKVGLDQARKGRLIDGESVFAEWEAGSSRRRRKGK